MARCSIRVRRLEQMRHQPTDRPRIATKTRDSTDADKVTIRFCASELIGSRAAPRMDRMDTPHVRPGWADIRSAIALGYLSSAGNVEEAAELRSVAIDAIHSARNISRVR
jgi:hypothetical protein